MKFETEKNRIIKEIKNFTNLSELQIRALEDYVILLLQENQNYNFIGKSTIEDIWERHILDSAQIMKFIDDKNKKFADFGSGAGLPGIILSILGLSEIHLVEKSFRKSQFLHKAKIISKNKIFIHQAKLEELENIKFDCITSRALAPLDKLLNYSKSFLTNDGYCLFLKGKNIIKEIKSAKNHHDFEYELFDSLTSKESSIIKIWNIKK